MDQVVPWVALLKVIAPFCPVAGRGRRPYPLRTMVRVHLLQKLVRPKRPAMEEVLYEISSMRSLPGETTILDSVE